MTLFPPFRSSLRNATFQIVTKLAICCVLILLVVQFAPAQQFNTIFQFSQQSGWAPYSGLTRDAAGNFYGTTSAEAQAPGTAYELKRLRNGWVMNPLFQFDGNNGKGYWPVSGVVFGPDGALYGTTAAGGNGQGLNGDGTVYRLSPPSTACRAAFCNWTEEVLHAFTGAPDGLSPGYGNVVFDRAGNLYGTTHAGGNTACSGGCGIVYELSPSPSGWTYQVIYRFAGGGDGGYPASGVTVDASGNLYGTTSGGGVASCDNGCGTVYQLSPSGSGWVHKILYTFQAADDGYWPYGGVIFDSSGNLFGSTVEGDYGPDGGTIFELTPSGNTWNFSLLYSLSGQAGPIDNLVMDATGSLIGTAYLDGDNYTGSVFRLTPHNGAWTYTQLLSFDYGIQNQTGIEPIGAPFVDGLGNIYGTASEGGIQNCIFEVNCGTIWEITP